MKTKIAGMIIAVLSLSTLGLVGCSGNEKAEATGFVDEVVDSVAAALADNIAESISVSNGFEGPFLAQEEPGDMIEPAVVVEAELVQFPPFDEVLLDDTLAYGVFDGGLLVYNLRANDFIIIEVEDHLTAITKHGGSVFAGGRGLYEVQGAELRPVEIELDGCIEVLCSDQASLMIGTSSGLYARNIFGLFTLMEKVTVTALATDHDGLWVGTAGSGLYHYNGEKFRQRYLVRDSSLFDYVKALSFGHNHLYVATDEALFVYDGGRWQERGPDQGLPESEIGSIEADGWVVYLGTPTGVYSLFDDEFDIVGKLSDYRVVDIDRQGDRILVSTETRGLVLKSGPTFRTLVKPDIARPDEFAVVIH